MIKTLKLKTKTFHKLTYTTYQNILKTKQKLSDIKLHCNKHTNFTLYYSTKLMIIFHVYYKHDLIDITVRVSFSIDIICSSLYIAFITSIISL